MPTVIRTSLPGTSLLSDRKAPEDFLDCYAVRSDADPRQAAEIITAFPGWVQGLLRLRGLIVAPIGLSAEGPEAADKLGPFPVEVETPDEVIAGFNDKHLDFRVSVLRANGRIHLATWVHRHNFLGRAYLAAIMPFHILIARNALSRVAQAA